MIAILELACCLASSSHEVKCSNVSLLYVCVGVGMCVWVCEYMSVGMWMCDCVTLISTLILIVV